MCAAAFVCGCATFDGDVALSRGDYAQAETLYKQALEEKPGDRTLLRKLGRTYLDKGDYDRAIELLAPLAASDPSDYRSKYYYGLAEIGLGQAEQGYDRIRDIRVPFKFYMQKEISCSADWVQKKELPPKEAIPLMERYLDYIKRRQDVRDRYQWNDEVYLGYDCPPILSKPIIGVWGFN